MISLEFIYRKSAPTSPPIADMAAFEAEILAAFAANITILEAFWTSAASKGMSFTSSDSLVERGVLYASPTNDIAIAGGDYLVGIAGVSAAWTTERVEHKRPSRAGSIEEDVFDAFSMQLDRTIARMIMQAGGKPKTDGRRIREAIAPHIRAALQLNVTTGERDQDERLDEQMRRLASAGRRSFNALSLDSAQAERERSGEQAVRRYSGLAHLVTDNTVEALRGERDPDLRRELVTLVVLAELCALARGVHGAHDDARRSGTGSVRDGVFVDEITSELKMKKSTAYEIDERPRRALDRLQTLAAIGYRNEALHTEYLFLLLAIEIALRFEIDVLQLFPSRARFRPIVQAAIAISAFHRRAALPNPDSHHAYFVYYGLLAMLDGEARLEAYRRPFRDVLGAIPPQLIAFACCGSTPQYLVGKTPVFSR